MKYKTNIWQKYFYFNIIIIFVLIILLTITLLDSIIFGTQIYNNLTNKIEKETKINNYLLVKIFSYISNAILLISFVIYIVLARNKIKVGYLFAFSWILVFIILTYAPFYADDTFETVGKIIINILISTSNLLIIFSLFWVLQIIFKNRRIKKYQMYKIHSARKDNDKHEKNSAL